MSIEVGKRSCSITDVPVVVEQERVQERVKKKVIKVVENNQVIGTEVHDVRPIKLCCTFAGHKCIALVDSGASGNFVSRSYVEKNKLLCKPLQGCASTTVKLANGHVEDISRCVTGQLVVSGSTEPITLTVITLHGYDIILGMPWLVKHNPSVDWCKGGITLVMLLILI